MAATLAFSANAARPFHKGFDAPRQHTAAKGTAFFAPSRAAEMTNLLNEDFSRFSQGSEDAPAAEIAYEDIYHVPASLTSTPGWTAQGLRPAGGCVSLHPWTDSYGDERNGYISTPPLMLDGTAELTFRARVSGSSTGLLWLALCDDDYGPGYDSFDLELTDTWKEFKVTATNGSLELPSYFQFSAEEGTVLIDDVKLDFRRDRIGTPQPNYAANISPTEFIASWQPVSGAEAYLLTVLCTSAPTDAVSGTLEENFDKINLSSDGKTIDASNPGYPEGWTISVSGAGSQDVATEKSDMSSEPVALKFDAVGDMIESATTPEPIDEITFWAKPSVYSDTGDYMSLIRVELYHANTDRWENVAHLAYYNFPPEGGLYTLDGQILGNDVTRIRLSYIQKGEPDFYIDDIRMHYTTRGITTPFIEDLRVEDTKYTVSGINPENEYNYFVKAVREDLTSSASYSIWVDGITGLKVQTLDPTDITQESFTANWSQLGHATDYTINVFRVLEAIADMKDVVVLEESFDNIKEGTPEEPGRDWISPFNFGEKGWANSSWRATQPAWAEGMAGTTGTNIWMNEAGLVYTPDLDLSCYDGNGITIDAAFYTTVDTFEIQGASEKEGVFAILMKSSDLRTPIASALLETPSIGLTEGKMVINNIPADADLSNVVIAFMNKSGLTFFVDHVKISMNVPAGKKLSTPLSMAITKEKSHKVTGLDPMCDHAFSVSGAATHDYFNFVSEPSDLRIDKTSTAAVDRISDKAAGEIHVSSANGILSVNASDDIHSDIYDTAGRFVAGGDGTYSITLNAGIYFVVSGGRSVKILVR